MFCVNDYIRRTEVESAILTVVSFSASSDVRLDVEVYSSTQEADRLLDCIVSFGTDFPVRDSKGTEVIPSLEGEISSSESSHQKFSVF